MPPKNKPSAEEQQIREMAKMSLMSNKINPIQEKNLKMFPFVFFDGVKEAKIEYDFTNNNTVETEEVVNTEEDVKKGKDKLEIKYKFHKVDTRHFCVSYSLSIDLSADNFSIDKRYSALENAVRNLFWTETRVRITVNDELKYESKNV